VCLTTIRIREVLNGLFACPTSKKKFWLKIIFEKERTELFGPLKRVSFKCKIVREKKINRCRKKCQNVILEKNSKRNINL
jgi:hypothetical protein